MWSGSGLERLYMGGRAIKVSRSGLNMSGSGLKRAEIDGSGLQMSERGFGMRIGWEWVRMDWNKSEWMRVDGSGWEHS